MFDDPKDVAWKVPRQRSSTAKRCNAPIDVDQLAAIGLLQAQDGEDTCLIQKFFPDVCEGRYLEIGAYDGIHHSNSYAFYASDLEWKGVNVELDPDNYQMLVKNRRYDLANIRAAVCSDTQQVHYALSKNKSVGGIYEYASVAHRNQWWNGITLFETIPMKCTPLQRIFDQTVKCDNFFFDFMTLDIEGAEYSALLGIDFNKVAFGGIVSERSDVDDINWRLNDLLYSKGYEKMRDNPCGNTMSAHMWYRNRDFDNIYGRLNALDASTQLRRR